MVGMLAVVQGRSTCFEMFMEGHATAMVGLPLRAGWSGGSVVGDLPCAPKRWFLLGVWDTRLPDTRSPFGTTLVRAPYAHAH